MKKNITLTLHMLRITKEKKKTLKKLEKAGKVNT